jgi:hypothetical protein
MCKSYRGPSIDASCEISLSMAKQFQRRRFLENDKPETKIAYGTMFAKDRNEMRNFYRETSIDASYIVPRCGLFVLGVSEEKIFRNLPTRNKNCPWQLCLLKDLNEIITLNRGPSIDASYQVSVHLAKRFQRRRFLEIDQPETKIAHGSHVCKGIRTK